jgi:hypothetical protein
MGNVIKLDDQRRGVFPDPFKAGDTLVVDVLGPDAISMHLAKPAEMAIVEPRWGKGRLFGADVQLSRVEIAAAVRADRNVLGRCLPGKSS